jgi:hypothetical protein
LARKRRKTGNAGGSRKRPAGETPQVALSQDPIPSRSKSAFLSGRLIWLATMAALLIVVAAGFGFHLRNSRGITAQDRSVAAFVGSDTCAGCHQTQAKLWDASQHKVAMQHATDKTVLGDFNDASFDYYGVHSVRVEVPV